MNTFNINDEKRYLIVTKTEPVKFVTFNFINQTYYLGDDVNIASKCASKSVAKQMLDNFKSVCSDLKIVPVKVSYEVLDD